MVGNSTAASDRAWEIEFEVVQPLGGGRCGRSSPARVRSGDPVPPVPCQAEECAGEFHVETLIGPKGAAGVNITCSADAGHRAALIMRRR